MRRCSVQIETNAPADIKQPVRPHDPHHTPVFRRTALANLAHGMQAISGGRFFLGLGSQVRPHIEKRFSAAKCAARPTPGPGWSVCALACACLRGAAESL